jgi:phosphoglycerol geranylgeranyltransferase
VIYQTYFQKGKKRFAVLIDPDKQDLIDTGKFAANAQNSAADMIFVGGSLVSGDTSKTVEAIKDHTDLPVILFPGSIFQISDNADAILFLSLISGRNPEYLIGNHVIAAPLLQKSNLEIIPVGYVLVNGGNISSVEYMSNTKPIPSNKTDIILATSIAGQMTGKKAIYLEAGSGAINHVPGIVVQKVSNSLNIPLIVGGGIKETDQAKLLYASGADILVIGNLFEKNPDTLRAFSEIKEKFNS